MLIADSGSLESGSATLAATGQQIDLAGGTAVTALGQASGAAGVGSLMAALDTLSNSATKAQLLTGKVATVLSSMASAAGQTYRDTDTALGAGAAGPAGGRMRAE